MPIADQLFTIPMPFFHEWSSPLLPFLMNNYQTYTFVSTSSQHLYTIIFI